MVLVGRQAPDFTAAAVLGNGEIVDNFNFKEFTKGHRPTGRGIDKTVFVLMKYLPKIEPGCGLLGVFVRAVVFDF